MDRVERELFAQLLELGLMLLPAFVDGQGDGDSGASVAIDGVELRRLSGLKQRRYLSVFGELAIMRRVYAARAGQKVEHVPLDARLGLPEGEFSYVLMDWLQRMPAGWPITQADLAAFGVWLVFYQEKVPDPFWA